jgi:hypothetical protein
MCAMMDVSNPRGTCKGSVEDEGAFANAKVETATRYSCDTLVCATQSFVAFYQVCVRHLHPFPI